MFSLPFVVSTALVNGSVDPVHDGARTPAFDRPRGVQPSAWRSRPSTTASTRTSRTGGSTQVRVELVDGRTFALAQPNPVGDADHFPLDDLALRHKIEGLVGATRTARIEDTVRALAESPDAVRTLQAMGPLDEATP